jgi:hypothetical protein
MEESAPENDTPEIGDDRLDGADLCIVCLEELYDGCMQCSKCAAPVIPEAAFTPWESIFAEGFIYRRAVEMPQSLTVVIGIGFLFSVNLLVGLSTLYGGISDSERLYQSLLGTFDVSVGAAAIWQCLKNYRNRRY